MTVVLLPCQGQLPINHSFIAFSRSANVLVYFNVILKYVTSIDLFHFCENTQEKCFLYFIELFEDTGRTINPLSLHRKRNIEIDIEIDR